MDVSKNNLEQAIAAAREALAAADESLQGNAAPSAMLSEHYDACAGCADTLRDLLAALATQAPPAAVAVPAANVTPMRQPRTDLARLVASINAAVYSNGDGLSVTEAIGALELAKLELLDEQGRLRGRGEYEV